MRALNTAVPRSTMGIGTNERAFAALHCRQGDPQFPPPTQPTTLTRAESISSPRPDRSVFVHTKDDVGAGRMNQTFEPVVSTTIFEYDVPCQQSRYCTQILNTAQYATSGLRVCTYHIIWGMPGAPWRRQHEGSSFEFDVDAPRYLHVHKFACNVAEMDRREPNQPTNPTPSHILDQPCRAPPERPVILCEMVGSLIDTTRVQIHICFRCDSRATGSLEGGCLVCWR